MLTKIFSIVLLSLLLLVPPRAAAEIEKNFSQGFARALAGTKLDYSFPLLGRVPALLVRATAGKMAIEWESEPIKPGGDADVKVVWYAGLGCNLGEKKFFLDIDGVPAFTFSSADRDSWVVEGREGARLSFTTLAKDKYQDRFGLMVLELSAANIRTGESHRLRLTGEAAASDAWVMTFHQQVREEIILSASPALLKEKGQLVQPVDLTLVHLGGDAKAVISIEKNTWRFPIHFGLNAHALKLPAVVEEKQLMVHIQVGREKRQEPLHLKPVRPWMLYLVQHTHTDIGYTKPQDEILAEHLRYIDYALDYCDQTDDRPDDARFRWTCETSWAPWKYLQFRPADQIDRLKKRVREGRIELTGMMFNFGEIADENILAAMLEPIARFKENGLPVVTAMQNDVNGFAWCLVDYFHDSGVRYISMGENTARALAPFDLPTPFWWESPSGRRILAFRADHYMTGNFWGLHNATLDQVERELFDYLEKLDAKKYPYDAVSVQYSGYGTDNAPPSTFALEIIQQWNEKYVWPKLRSATAQEYLRWVEETQSDRLPVYRGAWPDWWTDGFGSAMRETAAARRTQAELIATQGVLAMARLGGEKIPESLFDQLSDVREKLLFYDEHTFGAAESISDPLAENSQVQWREKSAPLWDAVMQSRLLRESALRLMEKNVPRGPEPVIVVFNTLPFPRSGVCRIFIDHQLWPRDEPLQIVDAGGIELPAQYSGGRAEGSYYDLWVNDVPGLGSKSFHLLRSDRVADEARGSADSLILENNYYRLQLDAGSGAVQNLYDKEMGLALTDEKNSWKLGQFIYETLADRRAMEQYQLGPYERTCIRRVQISKGVMGPLWQSLIVTGEADGCAGAEGFRYEIRLHERAKKIELVFKIRKTPVYAPEAIYIAFPFSWPEGQLWFEAQGGMVRPGIDQLPGSANDWNTVQSYTALRSRRGQIVLCSEAAPLMQFGGINTGRYHSGALPQTSHIFSWVLNNYWPTNFVANQEGDLEWRYTLTSSADQSETFASRFGAGERVPLVAMALPPAESQSALQNNSFALGNLNLIGLKPSRDNQGVILHVREVEGRSERMVLHHPRVSRVSAVNVLEEELPADTSMTVQPLGSKFFKAWMKM